MGDEAFNNAKQIRFKLLASGEAAGGSRLFPTTGNGQNYYKSAEWSPDGTCIITNAADNHIRTFIMYAS